MASASSAQVVDLLASGFDDHSIQRFDGATGATLQTFGTDVLGQPGGLASGRRGRVYVADYLRDAVLRFDGDSGAFLDVFTSQPIPGPWGLAFGPDGRLFAASYDTATVIALDAVTGAVQGVFAEGAGMFHPRGIAFGPGGDLFVASEGPVMGVLRFDGATGAPLGTFVAVPGTPTGVTFGPHGDLFVSSSSGTAGSVHRFDGGTGAPIAVLSAGTDLNGPHGLAFGPDGHLYVCSVQNDSVVRVEVTGNTFLDVFIEMPRDTGPVFPLFRRRVAPLFTSALEGGASGRAGRSRPDGQPGTEPLVERIARFVRKAGSAVFPPPHAAASAPPAASAPRPTDAPAAGSASTPGGER
jgi:DNA-binding beta-propeller fold protein YncE